MSTLFSHANEKDRKSPLANEIRPFNFVEIYGQDHILGEGKILRNRIESDTIGATLLYGPPGTGKTTIARAIGRKTGREFVSLNAAHDKASEIEKIAKIAREKRLLVFIDEIHQYNKTTSGMLLDYTEEGLFEIIGATSENPNFALTKALLSRFNVYELMPLKPENVRQVLIRACKQIKTAEVTFYPDAIDSLSSRAGGDARRALNIMESCVVNKTGKVSITKEMIDEAFQFSATNYDKSGDQHYDIISAFIKSMRGSDPDATLYWLARLINGGEDPRYIARRIFIHAAEDIGLADPSVLQSGAAAMKAAETIGYPEVSLILSEAALHVCLAPKSKASYAGINAALQYVSTEEHIPVPMHLRDTHYAGAKDMGREGYLYPHDYQHQWVQQNYAPGIESGQFFIPQTKIKESFENKAVSYWQKVKELFEKNKN